MTEYIVVLEEQGVEMKYEYLSVATAAIVAVLKVVSSGDGDASISGMGCGSVSVEINGSVENTEAFYTSLGVEVKLRGGGRKKATEFDDSTKDRLQDICHRAWCSKDENKQFEECKEAVSKKTTTI